MLIYKIDRKELKKAYLGELYECDIQEMHDGEIDPTNYDVILLQILLDNYNLSQTKNIA